MGGRGRAVLYFGVNGLHGYQNVSLKVKEGVGIFVADNGSGKTTLLYMLQSILSRKFSNLEKFNYREVEIKFSDGHEFLLPEYIELKSALEDGRDIEFRDGALGYGTFEHEHRYVFLRIEHLQEFSGMNDVFLREALSHSTYEEVQHYILSIQSQQETLKTKPRLQHTLADFRSIYSYIDRFGGESLRKDILRYFQKRKLYEERIPLWDDLRTYLEDSFKYSILYFPTYRRVEQGIGKIIDQRNKDSLPLPDVHFGMEDVENRQNEVTKQIRDHFVDSYAEISGSMLGQLAQKTPISDVMKDMLKDRRKVELVLGRIGGYIDNSQKDSILKICDNGEVFKNEYLTFFLYNLISSYDKVKNLDFAFERYVSVCNSYLINKEMRYDRLNATVSIYEKIGGSEINLNDLSSGEKQLLGVMSEIYLGDGESYVVIFDEPEISLSIKWQRKILVDIHEAPKTSLLIAATHSPFVFDNYLSKYVSGMKVRFRKNTENWK